MISLGFRSASLRSLLPSPWSCASSRKHYIPTWPIRRLHQRRPPNYPTDAALGDFLPSEAVRTLAVDYQEGLLDRLNDEVRGTEYENQSVAQTVISTSYDRSKIMAFNYASLALNNSFFLDCLKPPPSPPDTNEMHLDTILLTSIRRHHGSLDQLKSTFSAAAMGLFGSGYIWFVTDGQGATAVLPTFGTGTLLVRSRRLSAPSRGKGQPMVAGQPLVGEDVDKWSAAVVGEQHKDSWKSTKPENAYHNLSKFFGQGEKPSAGARTAPGPSSTPTPPASPTSGISSPLPPLNPSTPSKSVHNSALDRILNGPANSLYSSFPSYPSQNARSDNDISTATDTLHPLFCISVNEHAWMSAGYGVWGKEEYLKRFWSCLDWKMVCDEYAKFVNAEGKM